MRTVIIFSRFHIHDLYYIITVYRLITLSIFYTVFTLVLDKSEPTKNIRIQKSRDLNNTQLPVHSSKHNMLLYKPKLLLIMIYDINNIMR